MEKPKFTKEQVNAFNDVKNTLLSDVCPGFTEFCREHFENYIAEMYPNLEYTQEQMNYAVITYGM